MLPKTVVLPYDQNAEHALARVALLRSGVPARILDRHLPPTRPLTPDR